MMTVPWPWQWAWDDTKLNELIFMKPFEAQVFKRRDYLMRKRWYFRLISVRNGKTIAQSEGYQNLKDCKATAELIAGERNTVVLKA